MTTKTTTYFILTLLFGLAACTKVPGRFLSEKEMTQVLIDMQLAESIISTDYRSGDDDIEKEAIYRSIFIKHQIDEALYDSSLLWYGRNLDIYMRVYENVIKALKVQKLALGDYKLDDLHINKKDSINIWELPSMLELTDNLLDNKVTFDLFPKDTYLAGSKFVLSMHVWGVPSDTLYYPVLKFRIEQRDTILTFEQKIMQDGLFEASFQSDSTQTVKRILGSIALNGAILHSSSKDSLSVSDTITQPDGELIHLDSLLDIDHGYKVYLDTISLMRYHHKPASTKK